MDSITFFQTEVRSGKSSHFVKLTKWEGLPLLTSEVDQMGIDKVGIDEVGRI